MQFHENVDYYTRAKHYAKHDIIYTEVGEAINSTIAADWSWQWHEKHGYRFLGTGTTRRRKRVLMVLHPDDDNFDCYLPLAQWETWDGPWIAITAFPV